MEQTSLSILSAIRSTTLSSFDWAEPRLAMIACRPVRISRAEVAALSGMIERYQMRRCRVTREMAPGADGPPPAQGRRSGGLRHGEGDEGLADCAFDLPVLADGDVERAAGEPVVAGEVRGAAAVSRLLVPADQPGIFGRVVLDHLGVDPGLHGREAERHRQNCVHDHIEYSISQLRRCAGVPSRTMPNRGMTRFQ